MEHDIFVAMARALKRRAAIATDEVVIVTEEALAKYAKSQGVQSPDTFVRLEIGGRHAKHLPQHCSVENCNTDTKRVCF